jgi:peptidyl-prolyl cis-trans isomerase SurA
MKRNFLFGLILSLATTGFAQNNDPVIMRVNNKDIHRSEFEYIYNKNNKNSSVEQKTLDEYVDLFVNYKLKVAAAETAGIDTTKTFKREFQEYRNQLKAAYLTDEQADEENIKSVYHRLKENISASHILILVKANAPQSKVKAARAKAEEARQRLLKGESFAKVAREMSQDPSAKRNGGSLGYFTALELVKPFEDAVYNMKKGEISQPVRTNFGFHIIRLDDRRPDVGRAQVAHIFKYISPKAKPAQIEKYKQTMDSIYAELRKGGDFAKLAKACSDDKKSARRGGDLPTIGLHQTPPAFEKMAFSLKEGEISAPFRSQSGFHIIKMKKRIALPSYEKSKENIARKLTHLGRGNKGKDILIARLKKDYHFQLDSVKMLEIKNTYHQLLQSYQDKTIQKPKAIKGTLFSLAGKTYTLPNGFLDKIIGRNTNINKALKDYIDQSVLNYEDRQLENKYPEFKHLMQEYRDGILLFSISDQEVWKKAAQDTLGLEQYFKAHKKLYRWDNPHFRGIALECKNKNIFKEAKKLLKKLPEKEWTKTLRKTFNNDSIKQIKASYGMYVKGDNPIVDQIVFKTGKYTAKEKFPYVNVIGKKLKKGPELYTDVRGLITSDYQNALEKQWIEELRKRYPVEINKEVLETVNKH